MWFVCAQVKAGGIHVYVCSLRDSTRGTPYSLSTEQGGNNELFPRYHQIVSLAVGFICGFMITSGKIIDTR